MTTSWIRTAADCDDCSPAAICPRYDEKRWERSRKDTDEQARLLLDGDPDEPETHHEPVPDIVRISPTAFLRSMVMLAWTAFRYPFSTTVIDLSTGRIVSE